MYDPRQVLLLQRNKPHTWEDSTIDIESIVDAGKAYQVCYTSGRTYWKKYTDLRIIGNPQKLDIKDKLLFHQGISLNNVESVLRFAEFIKVFYNNGKTRLYDNNAFTIAKDLKNDPELGDLLKYLQQIAAMLGEKESNDFLSNQLETLTINENSILGKFLKGGLRRYKDNKPLIFPFLTNLSQKEAVKMVFTNDFSIIQGPPGTGKTQTIENIVANCILRGGSVAVLSGNNAAVQNVFDKIGKEGYGYLNADLGCSENVQAFFAKKPAELPAFGQPQSTAPAEEELEKTARLLEKCLSVKVDIAKLRRRVCEYATEKEISDAEYAVKNHIVPSSITQKRYTCEKLLKLTSVLEVLPPDKITGFFNKARMLFRYGVLNAKEIAEHRDDIVEYLKNKYYDCKIAAYEKEISRQEKFLSDNNASSLASKHVAVSNQILLQAVTNRLAGLKEELFTKENYRANFRKFIRRYPIVYSTTHSIRSCTGTNYLYDCVIIDESSQVDLITAVIAMSCAKKVVLVGDNKQLPHVVKSQLQPEMRKIFAEYQLPAYFDYIDNNILQCVLRRHKNVAATLLNEHYRCDPQIIDFCNKRFYNNQLVVHKAHQEGCGVTIFPHEAHSEQNRTNEKEAGIIEKDIIPLLTVKDAGVIAPYRNQVNLLQTKLAAYGLTVDTIHKFQGRENDEIILSTVADRIKIFDDDEHIDFLNNANLINVALSRAKKRLYILASNEILRQEGSIIRDLQKYYEYYCSETKILKPSVYSVFDLMYDDYAAVLETMKRRLLKISKYPSENIIATVIDDICVDSKYGALDFKFGYPLKYIIKSASLTDADDKKFVDNLNSHCDFVIYNMLDKAIELVVEVDGRQHAEAVQHARDVRKDRLLNAAGIKVLRLPTTAIDCKEKIIAKLLEHTAAV